MLFYCDAENLHNCVRLDVTLIFLDQTTEHIEVE